MHILFIFRGQPPWSLERVVTWGPSEKNLGGTRWRIDFIRVRSCAQLAFKRDREKKNKIKYLPPTRAREQHTPLKCIRILYIFFPLSLSLWWLPSFFYSLLSTITPRCVGYVLHIHRRRCFSISFLWEEKKWATCLWGPFARIVKKKSREHTQYLQGPIFRSIHNQWNDTWNVHFMAQSKKKAKNREPSPEYFIRKYLCLNFQFEKMVQSIQDK